MIDDRVIVVDSDTEWRLEARRLDYLELPTTLLGLLQTRLDGLLYPEKLVLQRAAVLGNNFYDRALKALDDADDTQIGDLDPILHNLVAAGFIALRERSDFLGSREYVFTSKLMSEAILTTMLRYQRQSYNLAAAEWYLRVHDPKAADFSSQIAGHYESGGDAEKAGDWYLRAAESASQKALLSKANLYYKKALDLISSDDVEKCWSVYLGYNKTLGMEGDFETRSKNDQKLVEIARNSKDENKLAIAYHHSGYTAYLMGNFREAITDLGESLISAKIVNDHNIEVLVLSLLIISHLRLGEIDNAKNIAEKALSSIQTCDDENTLVRGLHNFAIYYLTVGNYSRAIDLLHQHIEIDRTVGDHIGEAYGLGQIGYIYVLLGNYENGQIFLEQSLNLTKRYEAHQQSAYNLLNLGLARWRSHQLETARNELQTAQEYLEGMNDTFGIAVARTYLGLVFESEGQSRQAVAHFSAAVSALEEIGATSYAMDARAGLARCLLGEKKYEVAKGLADTIWGFLSASQAQGLELLFLAYLTCYRVYQKLGDEQTAHEVLVIANQVLDERASQIGEEQWRNSYLENVPEHQQLKEIVS